MNIKLPLATKIDVPNLTLDHLLTFHNSLTQLMPPLANCLTHLTLLCPDFKLFNPLNERLINRNTFPLLEYYHLGYMDEERWPKLISNMNVLQTPTL